MMGRIVVAAMGIASAAIGPIAARAESPQEWRVVRTEPDDQLNVRRWPGGGAEIVFKLAHNARGISVHSCVFDGIPDTVWLKLDEFTKGRTVDRTWCFIRHAHGPAYGWVSMKFLEPVR